MHLVEEPSVVDPTYIEDFLLTYRTFLSNPMEVGKKLLEWFKMDSLRDTVSVCVCTVTCRSVFARRILAGQEVWFGEFRKFVFENIKMDDKPVFSLTPLYSDSK